MPWKNRYIGNPILSMIGKVSFHSPANDFHCGLRGYSKDAFNRMDLRTTGMEFASEMVIKATMTRMKICEVPTTLSPDGRSRPPHLRPYRDGWRHLRFMLLFGPNWLFLYPGLTLMLFGIVASFLLMLNPIELHHVRLSIGALIFSAFAIVMGFQSVLFAVLSRVYAVQERLYPAGRAYHYLFRHINLERGLIAGLVMVAAGLISTVYVVLLWRQADFGAMNVEQVSRMAIGSGLGTTLGFETILFSFLLSTLGLNVRHHSAALPTERAVAQVSDPLVRQ